MPLPIAPTILLAVGGLLLAFGRWIKNPRLCGSFWLVAWVSAFYALVANDFVPMEQALLGDRRPVWVVDELAFAGQAFLMLFGLMFGLSLLGVSSKAERTVERFGFVAFLVAGAMLVAAANDWIALALSLEIVQFASHGLRRLQPSMRSHVTGLDANRIGSTENGLRMKDSRYENVRIGHRKNDIELWLGLVVSICLWLGIALGVSVTASTQFDEVRLILTQSYHPEPGRMAIGAGSKLGLVAFGMMVLGLCGRIGLVPWQSVVIANMRGMGYWTNGCILVVGQLAGVFALARLCGTVWVGYGSELILLMIVLSGTTFIVAGAFAAQGLHIGDGTLRRSLASFGMLNGAWLVAGMTAVMADLEIPENSLVAAGQPGALSLLVFSAGVSIFGLAGLFLLLSHLSKGGRDIEHIEELLGLGKLHFLSAVSLMIVLCSVVGFPFSGGFWARWLLLVAGFNVRIAEDVSKVTPHHGVIVLLIVGTLSTLLMAAVTIRIAGVMFLEEPVSQTLPQGERSSLGVGVFAALTLVVLGLFPSALLIPLSGINDLGRVQQSRFLLPDETARSNVGQRGLTRSKSNRMREECSATRNPSFRAVR